MDFKLITAFLLCIASCTESRGTKGKEENGENPNSALAVACLKIHNEDRAKHPNTKPLTYDAGLGAAAQKWANTNARANKMYHSKERGKTGENLAYSSYDMTDAEAVKDASERWYKEIDDWRGCTSVGWNVLHFTQMVWRATKKLGCGVARSRQGITYVAARYDPRGNFGRDKEFCENVKDRGGRNNAGNTGGNTGNNGNTGGSTSGGCKDVYTNCKSLESEYKICTTKRHASFKNNCCSTCKGKTANTGNNGNNGNNGGSNSGSGGNKAEKKGSKKQNGGDPNSALAVACLKIHNEERAKHPDTKPLIYDARLGAAAQRWADTNARARSMYHSTDRGETGENLAYNSEDMTDAEAVKDASERWYKEYDDNWGSCNSVGNSLHFTQMVWRATKRLGCGVARGEDGMTYVAARYDPRGNFGYAKDYCENVKEAYSKGGRDTAGNKKGKNGGSGGNNKGNNGGENKNGGGSCKDKKTSCKGWQSTYKICTVTKYVWYKDQCCETCKGGSCKDESTSCKGWESGYNICTDKRHAKFKAKCCATCKGK